MQAGSMINQIAAQVGRKTINKEIMVVIATHVAAYWRHIHVFYMSLLIRFSDERSLLVNREPPDDLTVLVTVSGTHTS